MGKLGSSLPLHGANINQNSIFVLSEVKLYLKTAGFSKNGLKTFHESKILFLSQSW